ncbi:MAG: sulfotransferase [Gammaproteobacteria bacterium]|nr:sulfotransferase [Gammaproteobacteria bacterium]
MKGTRFKPIIRECLGQLNREIKIALTPVPKDKTWVFLVGCYNSGTTLLSELLGQHPSISALSTEGHFITDQFVKDYDVGLPRMWVEREDLFRLNEGDTGPDAFRVKKEWAMRLDLSKPVLLEKSPPNSAKTRWLQQHFENAHFVGIMRNGYAVAEGITRKADPKHLINSWPIEMSAYQWKRSNEVLMQDAEHLDKFMWVSYEDLAADTVGTLNKITDFVGLENFAQFEQDRSWSIHERDEKVRNMNDESISRLSTDQIQRINAVAGNMLDQFGYARL